MSAIGEHFNLSQFELEVTLIDASRLVISYDNNKKVMKLGKSRFIDNDVAGFMVKTPVLTAPNPQIHSSDNSPPMATQAHSFGKLAVLLQDRAYGKQFHPSPTFQKQSPAS